MGNACTLIVDPPAQPVPPLPNIQAVTFDVGGTLIRPWPSVGDVYAQVAQQHGNPNIHAETLNRQFAAAWKAKKNFNHSRGAWLELVQKTFAGVLDAGPVEELFDDLYARFAAAEAWQVFDDVHPTLDQLHAHGLKLGIISNWDERLRPLLAELRLSRYFEAVVISVETGCTKPARGIFDRAASLLAVPRDSILHVGDSWLEDEAAALAAGLHGLLLDRKDNRKAASSIPALDSLIELLGAG